MFCYNEKPYTTQIIEEEKKISVKVEKGWEVGCLCVNREGLIRLGIFFIEGQQLIKQEK